MAFKDIIKKKVPAYLQDTPEYKVFIALVKKEDIRGPISLKTYIDSNMAKLKAEHIMNSHKLILSVYMQFIN